MLHAAVSVRPNLSRLVSYLSIVSNGLIASLFWVICYVLSHYNNATTKDLSLLEVPKLPYSSEFKTDASFFTMGQSDSKYT